MISGARGAGAVGGSLRSRVLIEFLSNTGHFPIAYIALELLVGDPFVYLAKPNLLLLIFGASLQSVLLSQWRTRGWPLVLIGNLVTVSFYSGIKVVGFEGLEFFAKPHHQAFWGFSLTIGLLQAASHKRVGPLADALVLAESVIRTQLLLLGYWIFESLTKGRVPSFSEFFSDRSHVYIAVVLPLLGLLLGFLERERRRTMLLLRQISEWSWGQRAVSAAVEDFDRVAPARRRRAVLFMDIRGFSQWSDHRPPEEVLSLLDGYFAAAEPAWLDRRTVRIKLTADEVMLVLENEFEALDVALDLRTRVAGVLAANGLGAGIGVHVGPVVEGVYGSSQSRLFDVVGDVVNLARHLCSAAGAGEVLVSDDAAAALPPGASRRVVSVKGRAEPLDVFSLREAAEPVGV